MKFRFKEPFDRSKRPWISSVILNPPNNTDFRNDILISEDCKYAYLSKEEDALMKQGIPNYLTSTISPRYNSNWVWARSLKSAARKVNRLHPYLPDGTELTIATIWIGYDGEMVVRNPNRIRPTVALELRPSFKALSGTDSDFDALVSIMRQEGFLVDVECRKDPDGDYWYADFYGHNVRGGFAPFNDPCKTSLKVNGKVAADVYDWFNKISQCPLCITIPTTEEQRIDLLTKIKELGQSEFKNKSEV